MSKFAWVTLTTNDTYSLGALVLAHSLRRVGTPHQLAVLVTPGVSEAMRDRLKDVYNVVQEVNVLDSQDAANLALLARPELGVTFTKLHCWRLTQFEKCVFLDADTLVLQNCDELFEREELSAAPDVSWPDCFNSGVFVYQPSVETFAKITDFAIKQGSFDGGDQGLLNSYFADWATADIRKHLPFIYNVAAYASYCYLPAFKQFRDKIKILHFAGKLKPWLIHFNSESRVASTPSDYSHAADLIQLWWNIFCDNVHTRLSDSMQEQQQSDYHHNMHSNYEQRVEEEHEFEWQFREDEVKPYTDPWVDYYASVENENNATANNNNDNNNNNNANEHHHAHQETQMHAENIVHRPDMAETATNNNNNNNDFTPTVDNVAAVQNIQEEWHSGNKAPSPSPTPTPSPISIPSTSTSTSITLPVQSTNENIAIIKSANISGADKEANYYETVHETTTDCCTPNSCHSRSRSRANSSGSCCSSPLPTGDGSVQNAAAAAASNEAGLAGALSQLRLGVQRSPEQEAYEALMRRQCWESGQIDYSGRDSFDNIWRKISQTLEQKPSAPASAPTAPAAPAAAAAPDSGASKTAEQSELLTSADIEDGKIEYDPVTKASTQYKHIDGGYEMIITTPQPNGTVKTQTKTFWDPKPVSAEDMAKQAETKKQVRQRFGKEVRIDKHTTMLTREIDGGYEEVYTTINDDGSRSTRTKTFFDAVPTEVPGDSVTTTDKKTKKNVLAKRSSVDSDTTESRKVVQKKQQANVTEESTYQETRRVSQSIEITENNRTVRKNSLQEQNIKAITQTDGKKKTKKTKSSIPPPPPDFIENDTTTVTSKRVPGGVEYTYSTRLETGKTITTTKAIYEEEETELTEEEIQEYKKTLKDAEKHKNVTTTKKLKSELGTKKVVPSENPGEVTTVETIKIAGGTEYHYTTVTAEGIVKKAVKTVYDPVASNDTDEEEVVEEYEEEIIEPGEKNIRTIETIKQLPSKFEEEVTITHEKKEKKVKKSMVISQ